MHYAIHQHTAAELIYERVNAEQNFMGLKLFNGELPTLKEAKTAKNYLSEAELKGLNQLVSGYLDFAERQADRQAAMTMHDWIAHVDKVLMATGEVLCISSAFATVAVARIPIARTCPSKAVAVTI